MNKNRFGRKHAGFMLTAALAGTMLAGCSTSGGAANTAAAGAAYENAAYEEAMDGGIYDVALAEEGEAAADRQSPAGVQDQSRKLIKNVDMSVETEQFDTLLQKVEEKVMALGGYLESSNVYNGSHTGGYRSRSADITARIPAEQLSGFLDEVAAQSNVLQKNEYVEDVTLQYVDLDSHKKALLAEQESLLSMLENAESIEDIIKINEQLTSVRYQIESMESQLRTYDNKISYSTVNLNVQEVEQYEPYVAKSAGDRIREGFLKNLRRVGNGIADFAIEFVIALPLILTALVIIGAGIGILFLIMKVSERSSSKKKQKAQQKKAAEASLVQKTEEKEESKS